MFITAHKRSLGQGNIFSRVYQNSVHRGGQRGGIPACLAAGLLGRVASQHALQVVNQHALQQVSRGSPGPHPGGKLRGLVRGVSRSLPCSRSPGRSPGPHTGGRGSGQGVSRPTPGGGGVVSRPTPSGVYPYMH